MTSGKWKEVNGTPGKINELILEAKADLKERPDSHPRIIFPFNWLVIIWRAALRLKLDVHGQGSGRKLDVDGQGGEGSRKLDHFHGNHMCIDPL